jgi:hypothetical protein
MAIASILRMVRRGWRTAAVTGLAVLAAFCASGPDRPQTVIRTAADLGPLPADRYSYSPQDSQRERRASALLVRECMAGRGHADFPLDPRYPGESVGLIAVSTEYGVLDLGTARRWGYGWDPATHPDSRPKGRRMTYAEYGDYSGCLTEASRRLTRGIDLEQDWAYAGRRAVEVDSAVKRDPRFRAAMAVWSRCVAGLGFALYADPVAAYSDDAWKRGADGNTRHTQREQATAVADVTCKRRHRTAEIWQTVRADAQTADIARHPDRYAAGLRALRTHRANASEVLRTL